MYRPEDWPKCPCDDCPDKIIDDYGYFCNIVCQKRTHWICREAGADAMLEGLRKEATERTYKPKGCLVFIPEE